MKTKRVLALLTLCLLASFAFGLSRDWTLQDMSGKRFTLSENLDSPVLLIFWATWCTPCKQELTTLKETFDGYAASGVNVVLVSEDNQKSKSKVKPYVEGKGYTWTSLLDPDGEILKMYGGTSIPYTVLLDTNGDPQLKHRGEIKDTADLTGKIEALKSGSSEQ